MALAAILISTSAYADPGGSEIVAVVNGKAYTYSELEPAREWRDMSAKYNKGEAVEKALRTKAASDLRQIATKEILGKSHPDCDLDATPDEISAFLSWWQKSSSEIRDQMTTQARSSGREPQVSGAWNDIDQINPQNGKASSAAREKIETWKANRCIYEAYGGGRVHENLGMFAFMKQGETLVGAYESLAGYPYPMVISAGTPLKGYVTFYEAAKADGSISFPDARYEEGFFSYYRNESLRSFAEVDEEASIMTRYWEHPLVQPKL